MRILEFEFEINSITVRDEEVTCVQLEAGETLAFSCGGIFEAEETITLVIDIKKDGRITNLRQVVAGEEIQHFEIPPNKTLRKICQQRGAEEIYCPGGFVPITKVGEVAIPNFSMTGTKYFIMPEKAYMEITKDWE